MYIAVINVGTLKFTMSPLPNKICELQVLSTTMKRISKVIKCHTNNCGQPAADIR